MAAFGSRGERWLDAAGTALCERRNPALQIAYLGILGVMYWMYNRDVFAMLPQPHVPAWHLCGPPYLRCIGSRSALAEQPIAGLASPLEVVAMVTGKICHTFRSCSRTRASECVKMACCVPVANPDYSTR